jgi:hypothetical protein
MWCALRITIRLSTVRARGPPQFWGPDLKLEGRGPGASVWVGPGPWPGPTSTSTSFLLRSHLFRIPLRVSLCLRLRTPHVLVNNNKYSNIYNINVTIVGFGLYSILVLHVQSLRKRLPNVPPAMSVFCAFAKKPIILPSPLSFSVCNFAIYW